jgi:16S rRNA (cytosine1402-N4)-methyltransferase
MNFEHVPVMAHEIATLASETPGNGIIIDATLGGAGHSALLLEACPDRRLIAFDRDETAVSIATQRLNDYSDRVEIIHAGFASIGEEISSRGLQGEVAIVLFDLGVSSHQLDTKERGFTYRHDDAPLDMRMDSSEQLTAETIVNDYDEAEIERILRENADERFSRAIAREIVAARPLHNAGDLVAAIRKGIPHRFQRVGHPAKRTFQALRMEVNKELDQLSTALDESVHLLSPGGRILVLSYHSGEDKIVKNTFSQYMHKPIQTSDGRLVPEGDHQGYESDVRLVSVSASKKPSRKEMTTNPRAKSARLRVAQREEAPTYDHAAGM